MYHLFGTFVSHGHPSWQAIVTAAKLKGSKLLQQSPVRKSHAPLLELSVSLRRFNSVRSFTRLGQSSETRQLRIVIDAIFYYLERHMVI